MQTIEYVNPEVDRSEWPAGPWDGEPDKKQWRDAASGLPCLAVRHPRNGHWCGYVGVAPGHPYYGKEYGVPDVSVHWGLTFADKCQDAESECGGICHRAPPGEDDVWWLGFDCAHSGDYSPMDKVREAERGYPFTVSAGDSYRTLGFVERECASLAEQLAGHASSRGSDAEETESCECCGKGLKPIQPPQPHRRFCTAACRLKAWRKSKKSETQLVTTAPRAEGESE